jgi:hypothetical protein
MKTNLKLMKKLNDKNKKIKNEKWNSKQKQGKIEGPTT